MLLLQRDTQREMHRCNDLRFWGWGPSPAPKASGKGEWDGRGNKPKGLGIEMVRIRITDLGRENHQFIFKKQLAGFKLVFHIHQRASDGAVGISQRHGGRANPKPFRFKAGESGTSGSIFLFSILHIQLICTLSCTRCYLICCLLIKSITKIHVCMYLLPKK